MAVGKSRTDWWIRCSIPTGTYERWNPVAIVVEQLNKDQVDELVAEVKQTAELQGALIDAGSITAERAYRRKPSEILAAQQDLMAIEDLANSWKPPLTPERYVPPRPGCDAACWIRRTIPEVFQLLRERPAGSMSEQTRRKTQPVHDQNTEVARVRRKLFEKMATGDEWTSLRTMAGELDEPQHVVRNAVDGNAALKAWQKSKQPKRTTPARAATIESGPSAKLPDQREAVTKYLLKQIPEDGRKAAAAELHMKSTEELIKLRDTFEDSKADTESHSYAREANQDLKRINSVTHRGY